MGINHQRNPRTKSSVYCLSFPLLYPSFNFILSTLRGRQREIPNTSIFYSPHVRRWHGLPLKSKLRIVFNLNNNYNNSYARPSSVTAIYKSDDRQETCCKLKPPLDVTFSTWSLYKQQTSNTVLVTFSTARLLTMRTWVITAPSD